MKQAILLYVLCEDKNEAEDISRMLLTKRLVACTNVIDRVNSEFWWPAGGKSLNNTTETLLLAKTIDTKWKKIEKEIQKIHSYDNPAIVAIPLLHVTKKYYNWMISELSV